MEETRTVNNGVANCAIILTAHRMGYNPTYVELAKESIKRNGDMEPVLIGSFSYEATKCHNQIAKDKRHEEANRIALSVLSEYGY